MYYLITNNKEFGTGEIFSRANPLFNNIQKISVEKSLELLSQYDVLGFDTETTGLNCFKDKIIMLQLGTFIDQFVIDCTTVNIQLYKHILENKNILKIGANLKFDIQFLYANNIIIDNVYDVLLAEYVLYNGLNQERLKTIYLKYCTDFKLPQELLKKYLRKATNGWYSLFSLVYEYCGVVLDKEIRNRISTNLSNETIEYAAKDVKYLSSIRLEQLNKAKETNCLTAINLENKFVRVLAYVEFCGLKVSRQRWLALYQQNLNKQQELLTKLNKWIWDNNISRYKDVQYDLFNTEDNYNTTINWNSPAQLINLLTYLQFDLRDKHGKVTTDDEILSKYKGNELIDLLLEFSEYKKKVSTYGIEFLSYIDETTNRIHPDFTQLVNTSRLSCSKPNLTNIPADGDNTSHAQSFRYCFVPEKGNILYDADYSAQESIILINNSQEENLIKFYKETPDADLHCYVAKLTFPEELGNLSLTDIKKYHKNLRSIAKTVEFATAYGGNGDTISNKTGVSKEDGYRIYDQYMKAFPNLAKYFKQIGEQTIKQGYVLISPLTGRKYYFPKYKEYLELKNRDYLSTDEWKAMKQMESAMQRLAQNYPIQGQSAETIKIAAIIVFDYIIQNNYFGIFKLIDLVHDEILSEFPEDKLEEFSKVILGAMEKSGSYYCKTIPLKAAGDFGDYWIH